ncbi:MAG: serine/threonine protein kinase [Deltaproteobacteria bacterium]|nr:serine/threonine protein kinase [Deltaproteobacteria bacterium]
MNQSPSVTADPLLGHEIGKAYRLEEVLGRGGMAVVYKGRHLVTEQAVAVKVLPPDLAQQPQVKARFIDEARTLARLEHPNIVNLHNFLEQDDHLFLVMQFAEGETFDQVIEREGRVNIADAVAVGIETLKALEYAHSEQVVHRDIKPSNIIIRSNSSVKVMDFGIAKLLGSSKLTMTGQTMGTVRFMSPEQVRGKHVDHRSDLYSLGVSLYQAVTGQTPFDGETHFEIMRMHLAELPTPPHELAKMPLALNDALLLALEKRVEHRFQSAGDFRRALERVPVDADTRQLTRSVPLPAMESATGDISFQPVVAVAPHKINRGPLAAAILVLLFAMGIVVWAMVDDGAPPAGSPVPDLAVKKTARTRWSAPHHVAQALTMKVDQRFEALGLRVMSTEAMDAKAVATFYDKARKAYLTFLQQEGIRLNVQIGTLNLVLVPQKMLNNPAHWSDAKPGIDYPTKYLAPAQTLYVQNGKGHQHSDLPYGLGLHFCALIRQLSNARCVDLAEGYERYLRKQP